MDTQLCIICGKSGNNFANIFKTIGLKHKIETCLPIILTPHNLLPESICTECYNKIENFYIFTKNCLQNIIILESKFDVEDSCLKSKRKKDKSCIVSLSLSNESKCIQTEDFLDLLLGNKNDINYRFPLTSNFLNENKSKSFPVLVDYDVLSDSNSQEYDDQLNQGQVILVENQLLNNFNLTEFISNESREPHVLPQSMPNLMEEISERSNGRKRKSQFIENSLTKICRLEPVTSRRKSKQPKKLEYSIQFNNDTSVNMPIDNIKKEYEDITSSHAHEDFAPNMYSEHNKTNHSINSLLLFQTCLLCKVQLQSTEALISHFVEVHVKEYIHGEQALQHNDLDYLSLGKKKKSLPNLLKISDLKSTDLPDDKLSDNSTNSALANYNFSCPNCPATFSNRNELFLHLQLKHFDTPIYLCGICLLQVSNITKLKEHVEKCILDHPILTRFYCQVCYFGDDNFKVVENHILLHNFLLKICRKEVKNFDPEDYICINEKPKQCDASPVKYFSCFECRKSNFDTFKKFSFHRRSIHSIFHCDLCNKFYGRNSHLWKHVNRLHKGHPSITCQMCFKTSASKYHLAQHFAKIHQMKTALKNDDNYIPSSINIDKNNYTDILSKQESEEDNTDCDENSSDRYSAQENEDSSEPKAAPKEIDPSHNMYNNIITNYTPPAGEGALKCPKCSKTFHKKVLLKKHKKNCRPRMQKDLLTRCKSCARIFKDRQSLAKHLINYHSDYVCEICNEKVQSKCEIVSHIRFQHPSSHLVCTICENILRCQKDLLEHLRDHENSYVCQFCGDTLSSKIKLKMHILSLHRKILSLSCGICLKLFENQKVLKDHVTCIHKSQLDPLTSCPVCGKNYGSKWKAYDHINKSHGTTFKACKVCLELYECDTQLEIHMNLVHVNQTAVTNCTGKSTIQLNNANEINDLHFGNNQKTIETDSDENSDENENNSNNSSDSEDGDNEINELSEEQQLFLEQQCTDIQNPIVPSFPLLENQVLDYKDAYDVNSDGDDVEKQKLIQDRHKKIHITDKNNLTNHSKRTVYVNSNDPSCCEICNKTWPAKKHLWQHYIRCHKQVAATVCGICLKTNKNYESLQIHLRDTHPTLLHGQGFGSNFICRICGRYHNASSKLRLHMVIHENFDWKLLDKFPEIPRYINTESQNYLLKQNKKKYMEDRKKYTKLQRKSRKEVKVVNKDDDIFEESIGQVEQTRTSSVGETDNNTISASPKHTNELSFNNILQTLKQHPHFNILSVKKDAQTQESNIDGRNEIKPNQKIESDIDNNEMTDLSNASSSSASNQDHKNSRISDLEDEGSQSSTDNENCRNFFRPKAEELDSAIKSISYPNPHYEVTNEYNEFSDTEQTINSLNENEIESAVGSIL
ncbi:hypothetical protein GWI33_004678 [Rhynchophorus ferrugineus]|uniref:Uncharacterized protein n=1 Tax=Rhynchophorus ferrugineus TaxID=354439 RepID=A0A834IYR5_RHYFE|nr:hypothetical protein GWI33_004678 [Rhynchophorus ferrugineus]